MSIIHDTPCGKGLRQTRPTHVHTLEPQFACTLIMFFQTIEWSASPPEAFCDLILKIIRLSVHDFI